MNEGRPSGRIEEDGARRGRVLLDYLHQRDPCSGALVAIGQALVAIRDWTFTLGPSLIPGVNALLLGYLMYRSGLVPRLIPVLGLIGAPLLIASATATLFRGNDPVTVLAAIATVPIFIWELSLGIYLVVKGFKPSPILQLTR